MRRVESVLKEHDAYGATFFEIGEHTPIAGIRQGIKVFKENGCDVIVAVGGGSPVDGSKAILYNIQLETGGPTLKQIAIPTTLSAAEYSVKTPSFVLSNLITSTTDRGRVHERGWGEGCRLFSRSSACWYYPGWGADIADPRTTLV